jgi:hypothetical protein
MVGREHLLFLLAAIGFAGSAFGTRRAEVFGRGGAALPAGEPDLVTLAHQAVADVAGRLGTLVAEPGLRAGAIAVLGSAREAAPEVRRELRRLAADPAHLGSAAALVLELLEGDEPDPERIRAAAAHDADVLDYVHAHFGAGLSPGMLARSVIWELASAASAQEESGE